MTHELRSAIRSAMRRPFYPIVAVIILALGLTASIAAFTYINGFYQPFPGVDAGRLVRVFGVANDAPYQDISYLDFLDYDAAERTFDGIAAVQPYYAASVRHENMTEVAFLEAVSGDFFSVLGIQAGLGRGIWPDDDRPGANPVAVISHGWWQRSFNGDPSVLGSTLYLNFRPFTVVGVMSPEFVGTASEFRPDVWIPIQPFRDRYTGWARRAEDRDLPLIRVYGRLRSGVRQEQGQAELAAVAAGLDELHPPKTAPRKIRVEKATWIDPGARLQEWSTLRLMMMAAGGLLLLVCANVANLLLSIATGRQHEFTMRAALGASPSRLIRQVLIESVLLSVVAGVIALLFAVPATARLGSYFARPSVWGADVAREATVDLRVVAFALAVSVATGVVAGLLPALRASRRNLSVSLKAGTEMASGGSGRIWGRRLPGVNDLLVSAQVGLAVVLLVFAGLVLRTFGSVRALDPGFSTEQLVVTHISTSSTTLEAGDRAQFFRTLAEQLSNEPWVDAATIADFPLLSPHQSTELLLDGQTEPTSLVHSKVLPGFFEALGITAAKGRTFAVTDTADAPDVAVVNQALAHRFFPGQEAVGLRLWWPGASDGESREFEIVGIVRDTKTRDYFAVPEPTVYFSYPQHAYPTGSALLVATNGDPKGMLQRLHRWLRDFEPHLAIVNVVTYPEVVRGLVYTQRMNVELFSVLASFGLGLAAVGIFSVMSLAVGRRTREIGVRMALGAQRGDIVRMVIRRASIPVVLGLGLGLVASLAVTELVRSLLYDVEPTDPLTFAAGPIVLLLAALGATYVPARRACHVDPVIALHHD
jgi:putative ABC transport system permease protein